MALSWSEPENPGLAFYEIQVSEDVGAFASTMVAVNVRNTRLTRFQEEVERGQILYMVDVPYKQIEEITQMVRGQHPEADIKGIDPQIPAFP